MFVYFVVVFVMNFLEGVTDGRINIHLLEKWIFFFQIEHDVGQFPLLLIVHCNSDWSDPKMRFFYQWQSGGNFPLIRGYRIGPEWGRLRRLLDFGAFFLLFLLGTVFFLRQFGNGRCK